MKEERLTKLLNELANATEEPVNPLLAEHLKEHIPHKLTQHKVGMDTVNIIIDLRINRIAAAAVIIITTFLLVNFLPGGRDSQGRRIFEDSGLVLKYFLAGDSVGENEILARASKFYEYLLNQGHEAIYYGDSIDGLDNNSVLMQWKLSSGDYKVIFGDLHMEKVSADELVKLQAQMLRGKAK